MEPTDTQFAQKDARNRWSGAGSPDVPEASLDREETKWKSLQNNNDTLKYKSTPKEKRNEKGYGRTNRVFFGELPGLWHPLRAGPFCTQIYPPEGGLLRSVNVHVRACPDQCIVHFNQTFHRILHAILCDSITLRERRIPYFSQKSHWTKHIRVSFVLLIQYTQRKPRRGIAACTRANRAKS